ncbi:MAG TPA: EthD family reductase [Steroidobacteraceae bacterium]|jgi:uncharacterized protein (TIGR02118 family)|nr:EthD family reductase [Steroidobacteraceae bacterium]
MSYNRRDLLTSGATAMTLGVLASAFGAALPRGARAADSAQGVSCLTILYPAGDGIHFNADYYRDHHLALIMKLYTNTISRFELRTVPQQGSPAPKYSAAVNIWIADLPAFLANNEKHGKTLTDDVPHFTNGMPSIQFDTVQGESGAKRAAPKVGDTCLTILYPNSEGVRWDVDYYRTHHMPLIMKLYGEKAIKRFELRKGDKNMAGAPPDYVGTVNIYIADQKAFEAAGTQHGETLRDDVPHFSSVMPTAFPTVIHGVA